MRAIGIYCNNPNSNNNQMSQMRERIIYSEIRLRNQTWNNKSSIAKSLVYILVGSPRVGLLQAYCRPTVLLLI